ncbi:ABC transporter ATP-binding protein [Arthrobacter sp. zg-Y820]|uniref:ABC transporter transmembrane domain-containing protein n=1 Tax=unclassified Arthrobacter TaxID=235627 RepID=UPI001E3EDA7D|nr:MULTISPECIES: ABC transporter ATP-binding protein [unclassified Arthrobacter]MCC9196877.1 ABC transporter ATP-binding protein/permease [Arthrobacter sp. zg-Y820]MDK1279741.1 ABC transporter ATP-binding protein [Arthrobacter sp. zg.Y820]WIB11003.1 ABC transporter ATP-binding protein [Arthrobacter sp. zg-Y820]
MTFQTSPAAATSAAAAAATSGRQLLRAGLRRNRRRLVLSSLLIMGHQTCEALVPVAIGWTVDLAVVSRNPGVLVLCLAALTALFLTLTMCWRWAARYAYGAAQDEAHTLRSELAGHFLRHRPRGASRPRGELLSISTSDADVASQAVAYVSGLWGAAAALAVSCGVLLSIDVRLGLLLVGVAVGITVGLNLVSPLLSRRTAAQQESLAATSALAADLLGGLRALHGLGAQQQAAARYRNVSRRALADGIRSGNTRAVQLAATALGSTLVLAVAVAAAGLLALRGEISLGGFIAAVGAAQFIAEPLGHVGMFLQQRAAAHAGADRIAAVHAEPDAEPSSGSDQPFRDQLVPDLSIRTADGRELLHLKPGEMVGLVADAQSVELLYGLIGSAVPTSRVHLEPHHCDLFAGTVASNLALAGTGAGTGAGSDTFAAETRRMAAALAAAHAHDVVAALDDGLDSRVTERGLSFSGGQRQRLALARALHADPPLLVLSDPTSAVDSVTEQSIARGIRSLRHGRDGGRVTVVATASPALLALTDRVVLLRGGHVVAAGTHLELLDGSSDYRKAVLR